MNELMILLFSSLTIAAYLVSRWLFFRYGHPLFNMVLFVTILMIALLTLSSTPYSAYEPAKEFMTFLLGPATVALAIPLYKNRELLRRHGLAIGGSVASSSGSSGGSGAPSRRQANSVTWRGSAGISSVMLKMPCARCCIAASTAPAISATWMRLKRWPGRSIRRAVPART